MTPFATSREIAATPERLFAAFSDPQRLFAAFSDPQRLARWWGPADFTNTFKVFEFRPGGKWSYTMHGPNGGNYPNESVFEAIDPAARVVIRHLSKPTYRLVIEMTPSAGGTIVSWEQAFDDADVARRIEHIVVPANEQNLDRLTTEVLRADAGQAD
jgi:uncharacterized protein YndB with AHSA1/START domain